MSVDAKIMDKLLDDKKRRPFASFKITSTLNRQFAETINFLETVEDTIYQECHAKDL